MKQIIHIQESLLLGINYVKTYGVYRIGYETNINHPLLINNLLTNDSKDFCSKNGNNKTRVS